MSESFVNIVRTTATRWDAYLNGRLEQREYEPFRESAARATLVFFSILYALLTIIRIPLTIHKIPIKYTWSELLINYQGGFVKRGLIGEILFQLQPLISPAAAAGILIFCSYFLFTYLVFKYLKNMPPMVFFFFVFSPAAFLFPIYDPAVFGRKEIFFFCAFALTLFSYTRFSDFRAKVFSFLALYTAAILIHEAALFFAPLSACLLVFSMSEGKELKLRKVVLLGLFMYILAVGCLLWSTVHSSTNISEIVRSWTSRFPDIKNGGALTFLKVDLQTSLAMTRQKAANFNGFTRPYLIDFCWALLPTVLLLANTGHLDFFRTLKREDPLLFLSSIGSLLAPLALFCFLDWGRWIHFISVHSFIFLVMLINFGLVAYKTAPPPSRYHSRLYLVFFLYYVILWRLPHLR